MSQSRSNSPNFDACSYFPARIKDKVWTAKSHDKSGGVGGATDLTKRVVYLPVGNNAYDRTVRLHESLHAIYTEPPTKERIASKKPYTMLEQALEDARLHLVCAKTEGTVRRDELATALTDLRRGAGGDKNLAALLALRSAAILVSHQPEEDRWTGYPVANRFKSLAEQVSPDYKDKVMDALDQIEKGNMNVAETILTPYFEDRAADESKAWPSVGKGGKGGDDKTKTFADVSFNKLDGKLTSEAADMLDPYTVDRIGKEKMPTLNIHQLFAQTMIPTFFGETAKHCMSGMKIHAKKLATIVGPSNPRLFLKTIRRNGGTVVIDASGSMNISPDRLLQLLLKAPAATIAFYNAPSDGHMGGNLWIFAHKGKRANDFSGIKMASDERWRREVGHAKQHAAYRAENDYWGSGNVVDFAALQWLLAMPAPRYILTDGDFTGPAQDYATELLRNAIARKKLTQITSLAEMEKVLAKGEGR